MSKRFKNQMAPSSSKIKFEESDNDSESPVEENDSSSEDEEAEIENELADIPFEELQRARADGTLACRQKRDPEKKKRANKNRPAELSSKVPASRFREVIQVPKKVARDPRFESLCGKFEEEGFKKRYSFIYEENLPTEKADLQKLLKTTKDPKAVKELNNRLSWIDKQLKKSEPAKRTDAQILAEHKRREREAAKQGKRPFYLKKSEIRKQRLVEKYNSLKAAGKLESFIQKKRRRNAAKDHRFMPYSRKPTGDS